MKSAEEIAKNIVFDKNKIDNLVSYSIKNNANGDEWKEIKLIFNGNNKTVEVSIPKGNWEIIAEDGKFNPSGLGVSKGGKVSVAPISALILAR